MAYNEEDDYDTYNPDQAFNGSGEDVQYGSSDQNGGAYNAPPQQAAQQPSSQPASLKGEDYFKSQLGDMYTPGAYQSYLSHASSDPGGNWDQRIINKENLRANNDVGSEYHADNKGGYLTGPAQSASKLLGGAPSAGGAGSFSGKGDNGFQNEVYGYLKGLFPGGGFNQDIVNRRLDSVRTGLEAQRKQTRANNEAYLADRGLIGSGPQATANENLESRLFGQFGSAYNDIYADESRNADNRMIAALQAATGMSEADAQRQIDWYRANTENALGFGNLDARNREISNTYDIGRQNAATASYTAQKNYDIATQQIEQAHRDYDEAVRQHDQEAADRAQQRINELEAIRAGGTHK